MHDALPTEAREALTVAFAAACRDPLGATEPYGVDEKVVRMVVTPAVFAVVSIGHVLKTITVLQITHLG